MKGYWATFYKIQAWSFSWRFLFLLGCIKGKVIIFVQGVTKFSEFGMVTFCSLGWSFHHLRREFKPGHTRVSTYLSILAREHTVNQLLDKYIQGRKGSRKHNYNKIGLKNIVIQQQSSSKYFLSLLPSLFFSAMVWHREAAEIVISCASPSTHI